MRRITREWVRKAEADYQLAQSLALRNEPFHDQRCFLCQQAAEKYLKALLAELGQVVPKTHFLHTLVQLLAPNYPSLSAINRGMRFLNRFAVETRYPGDQATRRQANSALTWADRARTAARKILRIRLSAKRKK